MNVEVSALESRTSDPVQAPVSVEEPRQTADELVGDLLPLSRTRSVAADAARVPDEAALALAMGSVPGMGGLPPAQDRGDPRVWGGSGIMLSAQIVSDTRPVLTLSDSDIFVAVFGMLCTLV